MKKLLIYAALPMCMFATLHSCSTNSITHTPVKSDTDDLKEHSTVCYVQLNDGTIKHYKTLKLVTSPFGTPHLLADRKTKFKASEITAYQNKDHYAISQRTFISGRQTHVAIETLPGFAVRIIKGRLNVYCKKYVNGQFAVNEYYLQIGDNGMIQPYSAELMSALIKDNTEAYWFFTNTKFKKHLPEKLTTTAKMYNGDQFVTMN